MHFKLRAFLPRLIAVALSAVALINLPQLTGWMFAQPSFNSWIGILLITVAWIGVLVALYASVSLMVNYLQRSAAASNLYELVSEILPFTATAPHDSVCYKTSDMEVLLYRQNRNTILLTIIWNRQTVAAHGVRDDYWRFKLVSDGITDAGLIGAPMSLQEIKAVTGYIEAARRQWQRKQLVNA